MHYSQNDCSVALQCYTTVLEVWSMMLQVWTIPSLTWEKFFLFPAMFCNELSTTICLFLLCTKGTFDLSLWSIACFSMNILCPLFLGAGEPPCSQSSVTTDLLHAQAHSAWGKGGVNVRLLAMGLHSLSSGRERQSAPCGMDPFCSSLYL